MSETPTHVPTLPEVMSVSMILGNPMESARIARLVVAVPTEPAHESTPSQRPAACRSSILSPPARPTSALARARGAEKTSSNDVPAVASTSPSDTSAHSTAAPRLRSMISGRPPPWAATISAMYRISGPLVLQIPVQTMVGLTI